MTDEHRPSEKPSLRWYALVLELAEAASEPDSDSYDALLAELDALDRDVVLRLACLTVEMLCTKEANREGISRDEYMARFRHELMDNLG